MYVFGPVPSRRLGRSLGVNNIPPKYCTYSCVYCQLGRTIKLTVERKNFYPVDEILDEVKGKLIELDSPPDFTTIVPDGEPTLDLSIGELIRELKRLNLEVAVITNGSLLWDEDVAKALMNADWISLKLDAPVEELWRKINRPHGSLSFNQIIEGMLKFSEAYKGTLTLETMLVKGLNDSESIVKKLINLYIKISPSRVYLSIPTRPPAESWVEPPDEDRVHSLYQILKDSSIEAELLIHYEGDRFFVGKDTERDILSILSVHPMREEVLSEILEKKGEGKSFLEKLIKEGKIVRLNYKGEVFYLRKFKRGS